MGCSVPTRRRKSYGTRKTFFVVGSIASDPDASPVTSNSLWGGYGLLTRPGTLVLVPVRICAVPEGFAGVELGWVGGVSRGVVEALLDDGSFISSVVVGAGVSRGGDGRVVAAVSRAGVEGRVTGVSAGLLATSDVDEGFRMDSRRAGFSTAA